MKRTLQLLAPILVLAGLVGVAHAAPINVTVGGVKVGELDVTNYADTSAGGSASLTIDADFTTVNQALGGQAILNCVAPLGLTYMQTALFNTNLQQRIFRDEGGNNLIGTFSDPPFLGYTTRTGRAFANDTRPWYSFIQPTGMAGAIPPNSFNMHQFEDTPSIGFGNLNGIPGLANVLNGQNGSLSFETALVGTISQPADTGVLNRTNTAFTGTYSVSVLEDFTWGFTFTYVGPAGGRPAGTYVAADYTVALQPLAFARDASAAFRGAFDKAGNNAGDEWLVRLTQADQACPEPATWLLFATGCVGVISYGRRVHRRAV